LSFFHYLSLFKFTEYTSNVVIGGDNDKGHAILFTFNDKFFIGTLAGPLDLHKESGFLNKFLKEQTLDSLLSFFRSINSEANLRDTGGTALAWAHT